MSCVGINYLFVSSSICSMFRYLPMHILPGLLLKSGEMSLKFFRHEHMYEACVLRHQA